MKIRPTKGNIVIQQMEEVKTGGILIPDSIKEKPTIGRVLASARNDIKEGEHVIYKKWGTQEIKIEKQVYMIVGSEDVLGIYEP